MVTSPDSKFTSTQILLKKLIDKYSNLISLSIITFLSPQVMYIRKFVKNVKREFQIILNWISTTIINSGLQLEGENFSLIP